jgi:hypothetical protein
MGSSGSNQLRILVKIMYQLFNNENESAEDRKPTIFDISLFNEFEYVFGQKERVAFEKKPDVNPDIISPRSRGQPMQENAGKQPLGNHVIGTRSSDEIRNEECSLILEKLREISDLSLFHGVYISKFKRRFPNIDKELPPDKIANNDYNNIIALLLIFVLFIFFVIFSGLNQEKKGK